LNKEVKKKKDSPSQQFCIIPDHGQVASRSMKTSMELKVGEWWAEEGRGGVCVLCLGVAVDLQEDRGS